MARVRARNMGPLGALLALLTLGGSACGQEEASAFTEDQRGFFREQVRPLLESACFSCHGEGKTKGGLDLSTRAGLLAGGDLGPALAEDGEGSNILLDAVKYLGPEMPPKGKLPDDQVEILAKWIAMGAPYETDDEPGAAAERGFEITDEHRAHWAFRKVERPEPPAVADRGWTRNPIDLFILRKIEEAGLAPAPEADRVALLRRLYYDLTGLPPTPEQIDEFLADPSADAYERRVDALLASPQYGERWARHWLDIVRYAESNSFERDGAKPFVWRYRDYVVESLNEDKPYDQFVREQLAGDELDEVSPETITATGFYRLGPWDDEPTDKEQAKYDDFDDIVMTTGQTFLGLTINCARCHDHKIDPIPQRDYYKLLAFLHNIKPYSYDESHVLADVATPLERERHQALSADRERQTAEILAALRPMEDKMLEKVPEPRRSRIRAQQDFERRKHVYDDLVGRCLDADERARYEDLIARLRSLPAPNPPPKALSAREFGPAPLDTFVLIRGSAAAKGDKVEPGYPEVLGFPDPALPTADPASTSSGRRRVLADWMASPENPLTARVMVNRVWQHHFGRGIVRSPNDFGLQGDKPTHPELLDWLASEFLANGWRLKDLHRLMVTSATYRMSSAAEPEALAADPRNDLFWRFNLRRLGAEEIRDSILAVTGRLNSEMAGPSVYPKIPAAYLAGQSKPGDGWGKATPEDEVRRSLYIHVKRSLAMPILASFDAADTDTTCPVRFATTQPTQALSTINGEFLNGEARALADRLKEEAGPDPSAMVRRGLRLVSGREPAPAEVERGLVFLKTMQEVERASPDRALELYSLVLLNLNEFLYLD